jgi:hypothetical protein
MLNLIFHEIIIPGVIVFLVIFLGCSMGTYISNVIEKWLER